MCMKQGILLLNLGSPDAPTTKAVRSYLRTFLSDPLVIDIPAVARNLLLYGVILPFRSPKTAEAYQSIWTEEGSPLIVYSEQLKLALQQKLDDNFFVALGMRYGNPSIENAVKELTVAGCERVAVLPLFPQYSLAATGSAVQLALQTLAPHYPESAITVIEDFYQDAGFIQAWAEQIKASLSAVDGWEKLLLSYHGLPVRHLEKAGCQVCDMKAACPEILNKQSAQCYRAQCYQTSRLIAGALNLNPDQYQVCFQSRLGKTPWIEPYTDLVLIDLARQGFKNIAIACPAFTADCLETLEEIGIRAREQWVGLGGENLTLIPCLNASASWVDALAKLVNKAINQLV